MGKPLQILARPAIMNFSLYGSKLHRYHIVTASHLLLRQLRIWQLSTIRAKLGKLQLPIWLRLRKMRDKGKYLDMILISVLDF